MNLREIIMIEWIECTTESRPGMSGEYLRYNGKIVESCHYIRGHGDDGWWENDEGCLIAGTTHWAELPAGPGKNK